MEAPKVPLGRCQTSDELSKAIAYHLEQGGMRRDIYDRTGLIKTVHDGFETRRLYGIALNNYNGIRKSYPELPPIQIATSDPLSALAQIQQLCAEAEQNTIPAKRWRIWTCVKKVAEKGWQIFTKSFWETLFERIWTK
jgi:hypothetical protein